LASAENTIAHLKKLIARLQHDRYGASSERGRKLVDQMAWPAGFTGSNA
jgi:hypothetical protein